MSVYTLTHKYCIPQWRIPPNVFTTLYNEGMNKYSIGQSLDKPTPSSLSQAVGYVGDMVNFTVNRFWGVYVISITDIENLCRNEILHLQFSVIKRTSIIDNLQRFRLWKDFQGVRVQNQGKKIYLYKSFCTLTLVKAGVSCRPCSFVANSDFEQWYNFFKPKLGGMILPNGATCSIAE